MRLVIWLAQQTCWQHDVVSGGPAGDWSEDHQARQARQARRQEVVSEGLQEVVSEGWHARQARRQEGLQEVASAGWHAQQAHRQ